MNTRNFPEHIRIVLLYILLAGMWFVLTGSVIFHLTDDVEVLTTLERYKNIVFVVITALLLYFERRHADQRQAGMEEWYRTITDLTYDWEYWIGPDGRVLYVSPSCERITGYRAEEFMHNPDLVTQILHPEDRHLRDVIQHPSENGEPNTIEFRILTHTGEERWIGHVCQRVYDKEGISQGIRVSNRDITKRKRYEEFERVQIEELAQADKMITLGTLVSGVAHEINNPTNFITLNTPLLKEAWEGARPILDEYYTHEGDFALGRFKYSVLRHRMDQLFEGVSEGANRIKRIVASLKDFARPDPSDMNQIVDVNHVIRNAVTLLKNPIGKRTDHFHVRYDETVPTIIGSEQKLEQVLINLIQNALEALPDKEKAVSVASKYDVTERKIMIEVQDEGYGIPEDILARIFDPFFTTKRTTGGTGLGLSIASRIVKDHGGKLLFSSIVGKGTTAQVLLPAEKLKNRLS